MATDATKSTTDVLQNFMMSVSDSTDFAKKFYEYYPILVMVGVSLMAINHSYIVGGPEATQSHSLQAVLYTPFLFELYLCLGIAFAHFLNYVCFRVPGLSCVADVRWAVLDTFLFSYPMLLSLIASVILGLVIYKGIALCKKNDDSSAKSTKRSGLLAVILFLAFAGVSWVSWCPPSMGNLKYIVPPLIASFLITYTMLVWGTLKPKRRLQFWMHLVNCIVVAFVIAFVLIGRFVSAPRNVPM